MRKNGYRLMAMIMASTLVVSGTNYCTIFNNPQVVSAQITKDEIQEKIEEEIKNCIKISEKAVDKEETVYVITDANGKVTKKIVSDHLINREGTDTLTDKTDLSDIENVKSDGKYTDNSDGSIEWDANGSDVYYQGTTDKELPVDVKITYILDGNEIAPDELAGKSGRVTIRFEYDNKAKTTATVGGKEVEMYVPFTMISGTILTDKFSNIEVSNGKVINQGDSNIVVGYAFPGLASDLDTALSEEKKIEIPESFEITADVEDFSLLTTVTIGSADLLSSIEVDTATTREDIDSVIDKLVSATSELSGGSSQLADGTEELKNKFGEYQNGITAVTDAVSKLDDGAATLDAKMGLLVDGSKKLSDGVLTLKGAFEGPNGLNVGVNKIATGMTTLDNGLSSLEKNVGDEKNQETIIGAIKALADGAKTLSDSVGSTDAKEVALDATSKKPSTLTGAISALTGGAKQLDDGASRLVAGVNGTKDSTGLVTGISQIKKAVGSSDAASIAKDATSAAPTTLTGGATAVDAGVGQLATGLTDMSASMVQSIKDNQDKITQMTNAITYIKNTGNNPSTGEAMSAEQITQTITTYSSNIAALTGANQALQTVLDQMTQANLSGNIAKLKAGTESLKNGTVALSQGVDQLQTGANSLKEGVAQLKTGTTSLYEGLNTVNGKMSQLAQGAKTLSDSLSKLFSKMPELKSGISALKTGSSQLAQGTTTLEGGVSELYTAIKDQLNTGASSLYNGTVQFKTGLGTLANGTSTLNSKMPTLTNGTNQLAGGIDKLANGAGQLNDGISQLSDEGVDGVVDSYNNKVVPAIERIEGTLKASKDYDIFTQIADGQTSSVKFIYRTESIE